MSTAEQVITPKNVKEAMNYEDYRQMIDDLLEKGKTTGSNQAEAMVEYTKMNVQRMKRLDKQVEITDSLKEKLEAVDNDWIWLVLTEAWCGDAAQNVPVLAKMADQSDHISIRFILRDQNLEIMDEYLTNGGRSIPKLICLDADSFEERGNWGPRPAVIQEKAMTWKDDPKVSKKEWAKKLHKWYADNRTQEIQSEFEDLITKWQS